MNIKKINWIFVIPGILLAFYGILCYSTLVPNRFHKDFGYVFLGLGCALIAWGIYIGHVKEIKISDKLIVYDKPGIFNYLVYLSSIFID